MLDQPRPGFCALLDRLCIGTLGRLTALTSLSINTQLEGDIQLNGLSTLTNLRQLSLVQRWAWDMWLVRVMGSWRERLDVDDTCPPARATRGLPIRLWRSQPPIPPCHCFLALKPVPALPPMPLCTMLHATPRHALHNETARAARERV